MGDGKGYHLWDASHAPSNLRFRQIVSYPPKTNGAAVKGNHLWDAAKVTTYGMLRDLRYVRGGQTTAPGRPRATP